MAKPIGAVVDFDKDFTLTGQRRGRPWELEAKGHHLMALRCHLEGMTSQEIRLHIKERTGHIYSVDRITDYITAAMRDERVLNAIRSAREQRNKTSAEHASDIQQRIKDLDRLITAVRERYAEAQTVPPQELKNWLAENNIRLSAVGWKEFITLVNSLSLDRAIAAMVPLQREVRGWLDLQLKLQQLLPAESPAQHMELHAMVLNLSTQLCAGCAAKLAGVAGPGLAPPPPSAAPEPPIPDKLVTITEEAPPP